MALSGILGTARRTAAVLALAAVTAGGAAAAGTAHVSAAANTPGAFVYSLKAALPKFPCASCNTTSITGTAEGAIDINGKALTASGTIGGQAAYFETGCPPTGGFAKGTLIIPLKGSAPLILSFNYKRTGTTAVITATGTVGGKPTGGGTSVAELVSSSPNPFVPPCKPAAIVVTISGVMAIA